LPVVRPSAKRFAWEFIIIIIIIIIIVIILPVVRPSAKRFPWEFIIIINIIISIIIIIIIILPVVRPSAERFPWQKFSKVSAQVYLPWKKITIKEKSHYKEALRETDTAVCARQRDI
jgi:uncharacterized membrane protein